MKSNSAKSINRYCIFDYKNKYQQADYLLGVVHKFKPCGEIKTQRAASYLMNEYLRGVDKKKCI